MARLLLVDDDLDQLDIRKMILEDNGHIVYLARGMRSALQAVTEHKIQTVIMDLRLPEPELGLALISKLRAQFPRLKIIVVSGWLNDIRTQPEAKMVNHMLQKPVRTEALLKLIGKAMVALLFLVSFKVLAADFPFQVSSAAEVVADITLRSPGSDWSQQGREAALADIAVDGKSVSNLMVWHPEARAHSVFLGRVAPGGHALSIERNISYSAAASKLEVSSVKFREISPASPDFDLVANAPILYARPNTVGKFTDIPLLVYAERLADHIQFSVIFSNEDGGTSTRALMARWGRTTDIEHVYLLYKDRAMIQTRNHKDIEFNGAKEALHPLLYVSTDNNMVSPDGSSPIRYQLAPVPVRLGAASREKVMDDHPFTYAVAAAELRREGKLRPFQKIQEQNIGDPRTYLYVEARVRQNGARIAARVKAVHEQSSHLGRADYGIERPGWVRMAIELGPQAKEQDVAALSFDCLTEPAARDRPAPAGGECSIGEIGRVFILDEQYRPKLFDFHPEHVSSYQFLTGESLTWNLK
jgi:CheY-like chemotaxis protein